MSKLKVPQEKKSASLELDRRNRYGENNKSSRKNIPLSKQRSHMAERRAANQPLLKLSGSIDDTAVVAETEANTQAIAKHREGFRKHPDTPLKTVLAKRATKSRPS
jgi:hypothetical protein